MPFFPPTNDEAFSPVFVQGFQVPCRGRTILQFCISEALKSRGKQSKPQPYRGVIGFENQEKESGEILAESGFDDLRTLYCMKKA
jgi:hypothetical protein